MLARARLIMISTVQLEVSQVGKAVNQKEKS